MCVGCTSEICGGVLDVDFFSLKGKGKLLFFNRELEQVYQLAVSDAVSSKFTQI